MCMNSKRFKVQHESNVPTTNNSPRLLTDGVIGDQVDNCVVSGDDNDDITIADESHKRDRLWCCDIPLFDSKLYSVIVDRNSSYVDILTRDRYPSINSTRTIQ